MLSREKRLQLEDITLAPYAMKNKESLGRRYEEEEHPYRVPFERDRDRVIHCSAFRRLEYKTQVFVSHEGDYYRTRLTHTLEAAQIGRSIARALQLNEDLTEAIILAHDLGHTPFGHAGEKILNELMVDEGGFEHNRQSLRIVTELEERYSGFPGLNLSAEVLEGIEKHSSVYDSPDPGGKSSGPATSLEAQIGNLADEIAYNNHDTDDGLTSNILTVDMMKKVELFRDVYEEGVRRYPEIDASRLKYHLIKSLINCQVSDLINQTEKNIVEFQIKIIADVKRHGTPLVDFSQKMKENLSQLKEFLFANLYRHYRVVRMEYKAQRIITELFQVYNDRPEILPYKVQRRFQQISPKKAICDYISGMTDRYALEEYNKLFDPLERV